MGFVKSGDNLLSRYSHYHWPQVLNGRVRNGNGCGHLGMVTGKIGVYQKVAAGEFNSSTLRSLSVLANLGAFPGRILLSPSWSAVLQQLTINN